VGRFFVFTFENFFIFCQIFLSPWLYCKVFWRSYTGGTGFFAWDTGRKRKNPQLGRLLVTNNHMNKQDIAEKVHGVLGGTKADAERAVETMVETIVGALKRNEDVSIAGLGIFKTKMRAARTARNPRTGESVNVPSMRVPKFQAAKALKDAVR
jgi:DNA-binding protein HU-beta